MFIAVIYMQIRDLIGDNAKIAALRWLGQYTNRISIKNIVCSDSQFLCYPNEINAILHSFICINNIHI